MNVERMKVLIDQKFTNDQEAAAKKAAALADETESLKRVIRAYKSRIADLCSVANYARDHGGINFNKGGYGGYEGYDTGMFMSNSWSHLVGFLDNTPIVWLGIMAGGACGDWNFMTDGDTIVDYCKTIDYSSDPDGLVRFVKQEPSLDHLRRFVTDFPKFEEEFYKYIEKVCTK